MQIFFIFTFCSDGIVRVFTSTADRVADENELRLYEEELSTSSMSAQLELGGIKASE